MTDFSDYFASRAATVNPSAPSPSNWNGIRDLLAEELGSEPEAIYVTTISKPSNVSVRFGQSDGARASSALLAMHTDHADALGKTIESVRRIAQDRDAFAAVAARGDDGWAIVAVVDDGSDAVDILLESYPAAVRICG